jgi:hypothetical protein
MAPPSDIRNDVNICEFRICNVIDRWKNQPLPHGFYAQGRFNGSRGTKAVSDLRFI